MGEIDWSQRAKSGWIQLALTGLLAALLAGSALAVQSLFLQLAAALFVLSAFPIIGALGSLQVGSAAARRSVRLGH